MESLSAHDHIQENLMRKIVMPPAFIVLALMILPGFSVPCTTVSLYRCIAVTLYGCVVAVSFDSPQVRLHRLVTIS